MNRKNFLKTFFSGLFFIPLISRAKNQIQDNKIPKTKEIDNTWDGLKVSIMKENIGSKIEFRGKYIIVTRDPPKEKVKFIDLISKS